MTCTVNVNVPVVEGTPEIMPVDSFRVSPGGRAPETSDQVKGPKPLSMVKI